MAMEAISSAVASYANSPALSHPTEVPKPKTVVPVEGTSFSTDPLEAEQAAATGTMAPAESKKSDEEGGQQGSGDPQRQNEKIKKAVEEINKRGKNTEAIFGIHEKTNRVTIKIVDKESKDVIKEFPPEKTLDMIAKVWEMAGLMVDEKK